MSSAISAASTASVPDDRPIACGTFSDAHNSRSRPSTSGPPIKRWLSQTRVTASRMAWRSGAYCAWRSSKGTVTNVPCYHAVEWTKMVSVDVAVIGAGVTGLASALALAARGASVCVLEREGKTGRATSTHNSGVIHAGIYYPTGSLKAQLCVEGRDRLYEFCPAHRVPHARCGKLIVANDEHELAALEALRQKAIANGVTVELVDAAFIHRKEPNVRGIAALWSPDTGILEAEALVKALERLCHDRDVAVVVGSPLTGADNRADGIEIATPHERLKAATVVNASGLY